MIDIIWNTYLKHLFLSFGGGGGGGGTREDSSHARGAKRQLQSYDCLSASEENKIPKIAL